MNRTELARRVREVSYLTGRLKLRSVFTFAEFKGLAGQSGREVEQ